MAISENPLAVDRGQVVAPDVRDRDAGHRAHELHDLVPGRRGDAARHQRVVHCVEHRIPAHGPPVRAAPQHVSAELRVVDIGVGAIDAVLECRDEPVNRADSRRAPPGRRGPDDAEPADLSYPER